MRISERFANVSVIKPADIQAGIDGDSINMGLLQNVAYLFQFGAITGDSILKFYAGATAGAKTTALAFNYRLSGADQAAAGADQYGDETAVASTGLTLTAATYDLRILIIEFATEAMPAGKPWLTAEVDPTATVLFASCHALGVPRYAANDPATVI